MKAYISLLVFIFGFNAFPCQNKIPLSEAEKAINKNPGAGSRSCASLANEECLCFDGIDWDYAKIISTTQNGKTSHSMVEDTEKKDVVVQQRKRKENFKARNSFFKAKDDQAEDAMKLALLTATGEDADYTTHLMYIVNAQTVLINTSSTSEEKATSEGIISAYKPIFAQINTIRTQRDAAKAAFTPPHTDINPLY